MRRKKARIPVLKEGQLFIIKGRPCLIRFVRVVPEGCLDACRVEIDATPIRPSQYGPAQHEMDLWHMEKGMEHVLCFRPQLRKWWKNALHGTKRKPG